MISMIIFYFFSGNALKKEFILDLIKKFKKISFYECILPVPFNCSPGMPYKIR